nr:hypothetical protein [Gammaproteobacteria bacterium]
MSKNYLLGFTILFLTACGGSGSGPSGSSSTGPSNAAPVISSGNTYSVAENTTAIGTVQASDADGDALAYFIQGDDSSLVTLTGNVLSFTTAPDFEAPADANSDNVYKVTVVVSDGSAKDAKDLEISVTNVNEGPQLIVDSSYTVAENTATVATATVSDSSSAVTFSLSGTDSAAMTIGASSGVLAFAANPDFEAPADSDGDNVYNVTITATDDAGSNSEDVTVTVTDVVECTGACDLFISEYAEGSSNNKYLEIANFTGATVELAGYALPSVSNAPTTDGEYEFWNPDIFGANASIADGDVWVVCHPDADETITARCDSNHLYMSNGDDGYKLVKGTEESYTVIDTLGDFMGDPGSGWDICGVASGTQDHTLVKKEGKEGNADWTSSRGTTADDCDWIVAEKDAFMLTAWDGLGSHCYDSANDAVSFTSSATFSVAENSTAVGTVAAGIVGCNTSETVTMALSGADAALFTIDAAGALAFAAAPDFEVTGSASGTNDYTVVVTATAGTKTAEQTITVTVTDVEEADPTQVQFTGVFGGAVVDGTTYTHPAGAEAWAGFANENTDLYPFSFPNGGTVTFTGSAVSDDVSLKFKFERLAFNAAGNGAADTEPNFETDTVTVTGSEDATYTVSFGAQGENTFSSLLMYLVERDLGVNVSNVTVTATPADAGGTVMDMSGTFGGVGYNAETSGYTFTGEAWAGWAQAAETADMYPFTFTEAGKVTFKATAPNGDVTVKFKFERLPFNGAGNGAADTEPSYETATVVVSGAEETEYTIDVPAQADKTFSSFLMYFETRDIEIYISEVRVFADAKVDTGNGGGTLDMNEAFGGFVIGDVVTAGSVTGPTYTHPTGAEVWAGVAHDPTKTDVYPMKFPNGGVVTATMAAVTGDVVMNFKAEFASQSAVFWQGVSKSVSSAGGVYTWEVPATTDTYGNFLLYLESKDAALVVESVVVTPND